MAFDAFLKIGGIEGESLDKAHKGEIEVLSFSWGESNATTFVGGAGGGTGKVTFQDLHFVMNTQKASPQLLLHCAQGKHIAEALLTLRAGGETAVEFLKMRLSDVVVSGYAVGGAAGAEGRPTEEVSLNFAKIEFEYAETSKTGGTGPTHKVSYDLKQATTS